MSAQLALDLDPDPTEYVDTREYVRVHCDRGDGAKWQHIVSTDELDEVRGIIERATGATTSVVPL